MRHFMSNYQHLPHLWPLRKNTCANLCVTTYVLGLHTRWLHESTQGCRGPSILHAPYLDFHLGCVLVSLWLLICRHCLPHTSHALYGLLPTHFSCACEVQYNWDPPKSHRLVISFSDTLCNSLLSVELTFCSDLFYTFCLSTNIIIVGLMSLEFKCSFKNAMTIYCFYSSTGFCADRFFLSILLINKYL